MSVVRTASLTDPGRRRRHNEDAYVCEPPLFAIADGMGGAQAGELASRLAAATVGRAEPDGRTGRERVVGLIEDANRSVYERASGDESVSGMGTTMTVALVEDDEVWIGHVGDSRAYLLRDGALEQLTDDHSLVAELVRSGRLTPDEAGTHPHRSVITRALGTDAEVAVDVMAVPTKPGDVFVLCSDGLSSMVGDEAIRDALEQHGDDLDEAARVLVDAANAAGGEDNITVVLFEATGSAEVLDETGEIAGLPPEEETLHGVPSPFRARRSCTGATAHEGRAGTHRHGSGRDRARCGLRVRSLPRALRRRRGERLSRRIPGDSVGPRLRPPALPRRLREPAPRRAALPGRAPEALRPRPAEPRQRDA